jgi:hypothetical protein
MAHSQVIIIHPPSLYHLHHQHYITTSPPHYPPPSLQAEFKAKQMAIKEAAKEKARLLKLQAKTKYQKEGVAMTKEEIQAVKDAKYMESGGKVCLTFIMFSYYFHLYFHLFSQLFFFVATSVRVS